MFRTEEIQSKQPGNTTINPFSQETVLKGLIMFFIARCSAPPVP